ncbi:hypothetical protein VTK73DRAFT_3204 [Phialemonium thermophilum]|uniref:LrgB-like protein n=1 Tax=Phialemonium thermophilum TaxID=223376 RepID=A0ABR3X0I2_9PEZI
MMDRGSEQRKRVADGALAILWVVMAQFLLMGFEKALVQSPVAFPPTIPAMVTVFLVLLGLGSAWEGLPTFYDRQLRGPPMKLADGKFQANLVNRHMSIGFAVPIVLLRRLPLASSRTIGLIISAFCIAGILSTATVYLIAYATQLAILKLTDRLTRHRRPLWEQAPARDVESRGSPTIPAGDAQQQAEGDHDGELVVAAPPAKTENGSKEEDTPPPSQGQGSVEGQTRRTYPPRTPRARGVVRHPLIFFTWVIFFTVGLPLRYAAGFDAVLATSLLFALWFSFLAAQAQIKLLPFPERLLRVRTCLAAFVNPVLWTSIGLIAYVQIESVVSRRSVAAVVDQLEHNTTFAQFLARKDADLQKAHSSATSPAISAGDIAQWILNSGLTSWGFKMWECRDQLASSAGITVLTTSTVAALLDVMLGPALTRSLGLTDNPAYDLAFAARTVTIALGKPALEHLGGDLGVNAALVVANGIMYQMILGVGFGSWLAKLVREAELCAAVRRERRRRQSRTALRGHDKIDNPTPDNSSRRVSNSSRRRPPDESREREPSSEGNSQGELEEVLDESPEAIVASGVTVGINAAAMGTSHLYEARSVSAPYSALAMTAFGVATVGFAYTPLVANWVMDFVSRP